MIIVDFSAIAVANYMIMVGNGAGGNIKYMQGNVMDVDLFRHMCLESLAKINRKFRDQYGSMVIALDARGATWRHVVYPYYKIKRREAKAKQTKVDWKRYQEISAIVGDEIIANMPYKTLLVEYAEADDIIGWLARESAEGFKDSIIISKDKDFLQLQIGNTFIRQWSPRDEEFVSTADLKKHFFTMLVKGDTDDSVPNIRSNDDCFALKIRQPPVTEKMINSWYDKSLKMTDQELANMERNSRLIDLRRTPKKVLTDIQQAFENASPPPRSNVMKYFMANGLNRLMQKIEDF